ncbi:MAG: malto-oligosyltrehalose trehalohydrolase [Chroococcales cyanobacterium]
MQVGSHYLGNGVCEFTVWAPMLKEVAVHIVAPEERFLPMQKQEKGYWKAKAHDIEPGTRYFYHLEGVADRPDPASHFQPEGVHSASQVIDHSQMAWEDSDWQGVALEEMIIYELHVGTFTPKGTFEAIIPRLAELKELGVNAIEIMPVSQFPGDRNWGYDGVYPYAVQTSYGGPEGLKKLVNAAHSVGISVILDVVYNHFGPEGNYIAHHGPYFTEVYRTPWGTAMNFDDASSPGVRNYFIENALHWFTHYHIDALRLDAIHAIYDLGAKHILQELAERVSVLSEETGKKHYLIAESDLNDVQVIRPIEQGGYGIDAQWSDDFHHCIHTLLTGEEIGYYSDFGKCEQLAKAYKKSFVYSWDYSPFRQRYHGSDASDRPGYQFVVCIQNHDQVGNRMLGERLAQLVSFEALKLAAGALLLSPYIPLLFMGEEYGEDNPFQYFVSHTDPDLVNAVREGRKQEFADFHLEGQYFDPQSEDTFNTSKLNWNKRKEGKSKTLLELYQYLISLRRSLPALKKLDKQNLEATAIEDSKIILLHRWQKSSRIYAILNFNDQDVPLTPMLPNGNWQKIVDSAEEKWQGNGSDLPQTLKSKQEIKIKAKSFAVYQS